MIPKAVQPWGRAPTPLIPKSIAEALGHLEAPQTIKAVLGDDATLAELHGSVWNFVDSVTNECLEEVVDILRTKSGRLKRLPIYSGQRLSQPIEFLPFSTRTKNVLRSYPDKFADLQLRFGDAMSIPAFGVRSAVEFACVVESATASCVRHDIGPAEEDHNNELENLSEISSFFQLVSAWALGEQRLPSLTGALPKPLQEWPKEIRDAWSELGNADMKKLAGEALNHYSVPKLVTQVLESMDERLLDIANERIFPAKKSATLEQLGSRYGVTRERVRQLEEKSRLELQRFGSDGYLPVSRRAESLRKRLGNAVPESHSAVENALNWVVEDFKEEHSDNQIPKSLLLWLAGPYQVLEGWLLTDKKLPRTTADSLLEHRDQRGLIDKDRIREILDGLGVREENHQPWLESLRGFLEVENGLISFQGNILDKAYSLVRYFDRPMTVEQMLEYIGTGNVRGVRQRLMDDPRFWRVNKKNEFVLAGTEGYDEYTTIIDEIVQELESSGGQAPFSHLVKEISRKYKVKESSVVAYLSTPMFVKGEDDIVRILDDGDDINVVADITTSSACYLSSQGVWCWRTKVTKDAVRGSGQPIPDAFAQHLGCNIRDRIKVPTELGEITLSWPITSTIGAAVGSLLQAVDCFGATVGDYLFVKATKPEVTFSLLKQEQLNRAGANLVKLAMLLGNTACATEDDAVSGIAVALNINKKSRTDILFEARRKLDSRGETKLSQFIPKPELSVDDYIDQMEHLLK